MIVEEITSDQIGEAQKMARDMLEDKPKLMGELGEIKINKGQVRRLYKLLFVPILIGSYWSLEIFDETDDLSY